MSVLFIAGGRHRSLLKKRGEKEVESWCSISWLLKVMSHSLKSSSPMISISLVPPRVESGCWDDIEVLSAFRGNTITASRRRVKHLANTCAMNRSHWDVDSSCAAGFVWWRTDTGDPLMSLFGKRIFAFGNWERAGLPCLLGCYVPDPSFKVVTKEARRISILLELFVLYCK